MITAIIVMNYNYKRLTQQRIKGKVLDSLPGIPPREDGKITIAHNGHVPHVPNSNLRWTSASRNNVVIDCGDEIRVL
jgi:hypothetical protein